MHGNECTITLKNGYKIWTRSTAQSGVPVLMLHGGPGLSHKHLIGFEEMLAPHGYQLFFYDQLGSGNSDKPTDTSLWTIERFTDEVEEVRLGLGLENFLLFGYSWGGMVAIEYALKYQQHLQGLVISNIGASAADYKTRMSDIRRNFPAEIQAELTRFEQVGEVANPEYQSLISTWLYQQYFCRLQPMPESLTEDLKQLSHGPYSTLWGYNDFKVVGNTQNWNRWPDLEKITVPTLVMGAHYDIVDPARLQQLAQKLPHGQFFDSKTGSHFSFLEDQENYFGALLKFFDGISTAKTKTSTQEDLFIL
jgi:proline iminopeptidase